jgi:hypothetical protein
MSQLSFGFVRRLSGLGHSVADRWSLAHLAGTAAAGGDGVGNHRRYTLVQAFALFAGARWRAAGAGPLQVAHLVSFLARVSQEQLEAEFASGRTMPILASVLLDLGLPADGSCRPLFADPAAELATLDPVRRERVRQLYERINLATLWRQMRARLAALLQRQARVRRGRRLRY